MSQLVYVTFEPAKETIVLSLYQAFSFVHLYFPFTFALNINATSNFIQVYEKIY